MATLSKQARETIKNWPWGRVTIAGYTRHFFPDGKWHGDACGCIDDRCIGYHHDNEDDCGCLEPCLDIYVKERQAVNNAHSTRWRHMHCDNEPQHIQEFRNDPQGGYGPGAGVRCDGCGRPTDFLHDWVQILNDKTL